MLPNLEHAPSINSGAFILYDTMLARDMRKIVSSIVIGRVLIARLSLYNDCGIKSKSVIWMSILI